MGGVLADVEGGEMEPERRHPAGQAGQGASGEKIAGVRFEGVGHQLQLDGQLGRIGVVPSRLVAGILDDPGPGVVEALVDEGALQPVRLVGVDAPKPLPDDRQGFPILLEGGCQVGRDRPDAGRDRQLLGHLLDGGDEVAEAVVVLELENLHRHFRRDRGIAVAVATHPRPEANRRPAVVPEPRQGAGDLFGEVGKDVGEELVEVEDHRLGLVERLRSLGPELVRLPDLVDELFDPSIDPFPFAGGGGRFEPLLEKVGQHDGAWSGSCAGPPRSGGR